MEKRRNVEDVTNTLANNRTFKDIKLPFYLPLESEDPGNYYLEVDVNPDSNKYVYILISSCDGSENRGLPFSNEHLLGEDGDYFLKASLNHNFEINKIKTSYDELLVRDPVDYTPQNKGNYEKIELPASSNGYFVLDPDLKETYFNRFVKNEDTQKEPFLDVYPKELIIKQSPLSRVTSYKMVFTSKRARYDFSEEGSPENIISSLKEQGYVSKSYNASDKLSFIISQMYEWGNAKTDYSIDIPGFFYFNKKVVASGYDITEPNESELFEALKELDEFSSFFGSEKEDIDQRAKIATIIKLGLTTPFNYVRKQMGYSELIKPPMVYGKPGSSKTTIFLLIAYMFDIDTSEFEQAGSNVQSVARFAELMGKTTFPTLIDEAGNVFDDKRLTEMNKTGLRRDYVRNKLTKDGRKIWEPAYSTFLYASNYNPIKNSQDGTARRYHIMRFEESEFKDETDPKVKKFNDRFKLREPDSPLKKLNIIGRFIAREIIKDPQLLARNPLEVGETILERMYATVDRELPAWLRRNAETETTEDIGEHEKDIIKGFIHKEMMKAYKDKIQVVSEDDIPIKESLDGYDDIETMEAIKIRFFQVAKSQYLPWVMYRDRINSFVLKPTFNDELNKGTGLSFSLRSIAQKFEKWEYGPVTENRKQKKMIKIPADVFYDCILD